MIISPGRRLIFVHIPKTGGTAMALALEARAMKDDIMIGDTPKARQRKGRLKGLSVPGRLWKHSTLRDVDGLVTEEMRAKFCVFTLVRNPWDRAVSYYHWLREQGFDHPAVARAKSMEFGDFVQHPETRAAFAANSYASYVTDPDGVCRAHFVRLEHLAEDLAPIEAHLGFRIEMPRANASARREDFRVYYDSAARQAVGKACCEDVAKFGYVFDPN
ncbi:sulfotransferase family 2 domain-containing protein [Pseudaestuariivita sp.]|uniref:sulfotransferase family 2 domain-containing protein n=1 Tax=Pseudaestuariivita sp. TaxID=2211669 RepID=UPI00405992E1